MSWGNWELQPLGWVVFRSQMSLRRILWAENMAAEYPTAKEWYKANRRGLKKYLGEWIAYNDQGVISHDHDYRKMKDGIAPSFPNLSYVIDRIHESEFSESVRFPGFRCYK
ncbi:DUF5678 domain-containing protein [Microcoleus sp.]|uniref:DUF5678 domain-containing protein n=1 Tax=Microcoleus sp. TaxID=44472 RepID=UPI003526A51F